MTIRPPSAKDQIREITAGTEPKLNKKEGLFVRLLDKILGLANLKMFELGIGFMKGFNVKVEFFDRDKE